ncbi:DNA polymerase epsilon subunit B [Lindgomyces ingoldianus]|uniref:DNA polymerase epsilon subunit B n=1 Tax=Lindgomyces ingoldianus TaxID=673940 RepID=A0ACB6RHF5_9PLEO|nr:DNA polymerase epsilon subunit B [Lindgomyces ingoldianus]KAF2478208.1 DNA polymerase epsilon subunit B [Lindgomyces ingoldianus]
MATARRPDKPSAILDNPIPSSSPAFGTPVHPILPRQTVPIRAPPALKPVTKQTVLPILLPPATLRPLAFRTFTKKHNLTLTSSALQALATFIGRQCGSGWREEGLAEKVLEEVAKTWKKCSSQVIVEGEGETLRNILKTLEGSMSGGRIAPGSGLSRQTSFTFASEPSAQNIVGFGGRPALESQASFGMSNLEAEEQEEEEDVLKDPREWMKVVGAFEQPKLFYNVTQKHFEKSTTKPSLFPDPSHKTHLFRQRYHVVHQRILRNETFQTPTFSVARSSSLNRTGSISTSQTTTITPIANLLGRSGSTHLLLGMLTVSPTGSLALSDLTGTIALDLQHARPIPENGAYFVPGMIVLVDGSYEEDYGNLAAGSNSTLGGMSGIGGTVGGKFIGFSVGQPPSERRSTTLGGTVEEADKNSLSGPAFGWTDFLGLGSERATGSRMSRIASKLLSPSSLHNIVVASDLHLDIPSTLSSLRTLLRTYTPDPADPHPVYPLAIVLMGNFSSKASLAGVPGAASIEYKEHFDALASLLADFPQLIAHTSLVFVPGDNDAWPSAFSGGAAVPLPRRPVPSLFTNRIRRVVAEANREVWGTGKSKGKEGDVVWTSNPSRLSWFGVKGEMAVMRDDVLGRLHRTSIRFSKPESGDEEEDMPDATTEECQAHETMDLDDANLPTQLNPSQHNQEQLDSDTQIARSLTRTLLSQSHLSPFPLSVRPLHWDYGHTLNLYPLPTALVVADKDAPAFVAKYCGCTVMNPGPIDESGGRGRKEGRARWVEFEVRTGVGVPSGVNSMTGRDYAVYKQGADISGIDCLNREYLGGLRVDGRSLQRPWCQTQETGGINPSAQLGRYGFDFGARERKQ